MSADGTLPIQVKSTIGARTTTAYAVAKPLYTAAATYDGKDFQVWPQHARLCMCSGPTRCKWAVSSPHPWHDPYTKRTLHAACTAMLALRTDKV
jgi:hypothetical protein